MGRSAGSANKKKLLRYQPKNGGARAGRKEIIPCEDEGLKSESDSILFIENISILFFS
jgi:hypothetical protein